MTGLTRRRGAALRREPKARYGIATTVRSWIKRSSKQPAPKVRHRFNVADENVGPAGLDLLGHVTHGLTAVAIECRAFGAARNLPLCGVDEVGGEERAEGSVWNSHGRKAVDQAKLKTTSAEGAA